MTPALTVRLPSAGQSFVTRARWESLILGVVMLAALVVYFSVWPQAPVVTPDTPSYSRLAHEIREFHIGRLHQRTPGYPLIMALAGAAETPNRLLFVLMLVLQFSATGIMAHHLRRTGISRTGLILFVGLALLPPFVAPTAYAETETTTQFTIVLTYVALITWLDAGEFRSFALFVVAGTYCAFVRPTYELLLPALVIVVLIARAFPAGIRPLRSLAGLILATTVFAGALMSYAFFNYKEFGYFDLSYMGAYALNHKTAGVVEFLPERFGILRDILVHHRDRLLVASYGDHTGENYIYRAVPELLNLYGGDQVRMVRELQKANIYLIVHKPFSFIHEGLRAMANYWMPIEYPLITNGRGALSLASAALQWIFIGAWMLQLLAIAGAGFLWLSARFAGFHTPVLNQEGRALLMPYLLGMTIILYTLVISCFSAIGDPRYRTPADLIMIGNVVVGYSLWRRVLPVLFGASLRNGGRS